MQLFSNSCNGVLNLLLSLIRKILVEILETDFSILQILNKIIT